MNANEAARKFCAGCAAAMSCRVPCTSVLLELWNEHGGKTTISEMDDEIRKARRKLFNEGKTDGSKSGQAR